MISLWLNFSFQMFYCFPNINSQQMCWLMSVIPALRRQREQISVSLRLSELQSEFYLNLFFSFFLEFLLNSGDLFIHTGHISIPRSNCVTSFPLQVWDWFPRLCSFVTSFRSLIIFLTSKLLGSSSSILLIEPSLSLSSWAVAILQRSHIALLWLVPVFLRCDASICWLGYVSQFCLKIFMFSPASTKL